MVLPAKHAVLPGYGPIPGRPALSPPVLPPSHWRQTHPSQNTNGYKARRSMLGHFVPPKGGRFASRLYINAFGTDSRGQAGVWLCHETNIELLSLKLSQETNPQGRRHAINNFCHNTFLAFA